MKEILRFFKIFFWSSFLLLNLFWENFLISEYSIFINIVTFIVFTFILSGLFYLFSKIYAFLRHKKHNSPGLESKISNDFDPQIDYGKFYKGVLISFILFIICFVSEALVLWPAGNVIAFNAITYPFLLALGLSLPFLLLNLIVFFVNFKEENIKSGLKRGFLFFLVFFILIYGINLYFFIFQNETYLSSTDVNILNKASPFDETVCYKLEDVFLSDNCFSNRAVLKKDISLCYKIKDSNELSSCLLGFSKNQTDITFCEKMNGESNKVICIQIVAANTQNPEYCKSLLGTNYIDACYLGAIAKKTDKTFIAKYCDLMKKGMVHQQNCIKLLK